MKIIYKKAAIDDLLNTENYIINQFHNNQAAKKLKKYEKNFLTNGRRRGSISELSARAAMYLVN